MLSHVLINDGKIYYNSTYSCVIYFIKRRYNIFFNKQTIIENKKYNNKFGD